MSGVIRRVDDLGRIVIPREIRKELGIREGEALTITVEGRSLKMWKKTESKTEAAAQFWKLNQSIIEHSLAKFTINGSTTICEVVRANKRCQGKATCNIRDTFEPLVGMVIAFCRAIDHEIPPALLED